MADELQSLLSRINEEGVKKAEAEREGILSEARRQAENIVREAKANAESIEKEARENADLLVQKGRQSLQQASRDTLLSLRMQLQERLRAVVRTSVTEALDAQALADIVVDFIKAYQSQGDQVERLEVLLPEDRLDDLKSTLLNKLGRDLRENTRISPVPDLEGGFRVAVNESDVYYDFSDEALAEVLCTYLNPQLAELVQAASEADDNAEDTGNSTPETSA